MKSPGRVLCNDRNRHQRFVTIPSGLSGAVAADSNDFSFTATLVTDKDLLANLTDLMDEDEDIFSVWNFSVDNYDGDQIYLSISVGLEDLEELYILYLTE